MVLIHLDSYLDFSLDQNIKLLDPPLAFNIFFDIHRILRIFSEILHEEKRRSYKGLPKSPFCAFESV